MDLKFPKAEKLKSRKLIGQLFSEGKSITKFPIKLIYLPHESAENNQAAFAVPKKNFKKAVDRNRLKRQLREAYRLNKNELQNANGSKFAILFLYIGKEPLSFDKIQTAIISLLQKLNK